MSRASRNCTMTLGLAYGLLGCSGKVAGNDLTSWSASEPLVTSNPSSEAGSSTPSGGNVSSKSPIEYCAQSGCPGCCTPDGLCHAGKDAAYCGSRAQVCVDCSTSGQACHGGKCIAPSTAPSGNTSASSSGSAQCLLPSCPPCEGGPPCCASLSQCGCLSGTVCR
jgi:hypothetical protein